MFLKFPKEMFLLLFNVDKIYIIDKLETADFESNLNVFHKSLVSEILSLY